MAGIKDLKEVSGLTEEQIKQVIEAIDTITKDDKLTIKGFGTFKKVVVPAVPEREGTKPGTSEKMMLSAKPERVVLKFKYSKK